MNTIKAVWTNGQIVPAGPVDWPEGSELVVAPIAPVAGKIGQTEDEWQDDPESIEAWIAAVERLEPPVWASGEQDEFEHYRAVQRQFNIDAVRKQMEQSPCDQAP